ncbi:MAG: hypothetical protein J5806_00545 [Lentisphaeria bacterium]|nr:hypothetical protein [Lentisphaeria bacterium]
MYRYALSLMMLAATVAAQESNQAEKPAEAAPAEKTAEAAPPPPPPPPPKPKPQAPPRIRTGSVTKQEFTTEKPSVESGSPASSKSSSAWAVLTITLDPGRAASVFDYVLSKDGSEYPCLDLADGEEPFKGTRRNYATAESKTCRMLFAIPSAEDEYDIVFKLSSESETPVKLNVKPPPPPPPPPEEKKPEEKPQNEGKENAAGGESGASESDGESGGRENGGSEGGDSAPAD